MAPKKGDKYEENMTKEIFKTIVPTFCQDIITAIANLDLPQKNYSKTVLEIYKEINYNNFNNFLMHIKKRKNIIYTFTKATGDFFNEDICIKNKFGLFTYQSIEEKMIESIKSEEDLKEILIKFTNSKNKNLLILRFIENDLNKMDYINHVISDFEEKDKNLLKKFIIFIVHKVRAPKVTKQEMKRKNVEAI